MRRVITISMVALVAAGTVAGCAAPNPPKRTGSAGTVTETVTNPNPPGSTPGPYQPATSSPYPPGTVIAPSGAVVATPGTGAIVDRNNRWRGAPVGGAGGPVLGGTVSEIRSRASREAAAENRPVAYQTEDGWQRVEAYPQPTTSPRGCRQVQERVFQSGQLLQDSVREVCS
jgi:hypothetical protein